jgi:hypothetical protein
MQRLVATTVVLIACAGVASFARDDERSSGQFKALLSGYQEVPSVYTTGTGSATVQRNEAGNALIVTLNYSDLKGVASMAHIHIGQPGVSGGIVATLCGADGKPACPAAATNLSITLNASDVKAVQGIEAGALNQLLDALQAGALYVNVHSDKFPQGEIRGQLRRGNAGREDKGKDKDKDKDDEEDEDEN